MRSVVWIHIQIYIYTYMYIYKFEWTPKICSRGQGRCSFGGPGSKCWSDVGLNNSFFLKKFAYTYLCQLNLRLSLTTYCNQVNTRKRNVSNVSFQTHSSWICDVRRQNETAQVLRRIPMFGLEYITISVVDGSLSTLYLSTALFGRSNRTTHFIKGTVFRSRFHESLVWFTVWLVGLNIAFEPYVNKQCGLEMTNTSFQKSADNVAWIKYLWKEMFQGSEQFLGLVLKIVLRMLK